MINQLQELETHLQGLKEERTRGIAECNEELQAIESRIEQANHELVEADLKGDGPAYAVAKDNKRMNEDLKEFYTKKRNKLQNETIISEKEYNAKVNEAMNLMDKYNQSQMESAAVLLEQLETVAAKTLEARNTTDNLLKTLQYDLFKREGQKLLPGGTITVSSSTGGTQAINLLEYKKETVTTLVDGIRYMDAYKLLKGDR